jgi:hypothetical protein
MRAKMHHHSTQHCVRVAVLAASQERRCGLKKKVWSGGSWRLCDGATVDAGFRDESDTCGSNYWVPVNANIAPSGSCPFTIQPPPGTSMGPLMTLPPAATMRWAACLMPSTRK